MIVRHYIKCDTCGHPHTLRLQVGHRPYQEHSFHCADCGEEIVIGMHCYPDTASVKIEELENTTRGTEEGTIIFLSPEFPVRAEDLHRDLAFPSLDVMRRLVEAQELLGAKPKPFSAFKEAHRDAINTPSLPEIWAIVKKGWSLTSKGREDLAEQQLRQYPIHSYKEPYELNYVLFDFCGRVLTPGRYALFEDAANLTKEISKKHSNEFQNFKSYYKENMMADNLSRYFNVFSEYFKCFNDFSQTLMFIQNNIDLPEDFESSSYAFDKTKLFYGNAYEALTTNIAVLACINNINKSRDYNQFEKMDLSKYLTINKANRANPFQDIPEFTEITNCLKSTLRNASHHGSTMLTKGGKQIQYRSGGTGSLRSMPYKEYLDKCNEVMLSSCALLSLELAVGL